MIIGITGWIGSGKTTIANIFRKHGFYVIDADKIGHDILDNEAYNSLIRYFGAEILSKNKRISRKKLGEIVFSNKSKLHALNRMMWPLIIKKIKEQINKYRNKDIVIDTALIIESGAVNLVDKLIVVKIDKGILLKRILKKERYSQEVIKNIINSQIPQRERLKHADYVIDNSGILKNTKEYVMNIIKEVKQK